MKSNSKCLFLFKEFGSIPGMELPSIKEFFNEEPHPEKEKILSYLKAGEKTYCATSYSTDFFTGNRIPGERCGMTDGEYTWNNDLIYYVDRYNLQLPEDFIRKAIG